jgi:serine/threonine protein kinase
MRPELEEDPRSRRAFDAEAEAGAFVNHPGLVRVLYDGEDLRGRFLVLSFVSGENLREVMLRQRADCPNRSCAASPPPSPADWPRCTKPATRTAT